MYFKGALFLHTLRSVVGEGKWLALQKALYNQFKYKNSFTEEIVAFVNKQLGQDLTPIFDQYLRRTALPVLELTFNDETKSVAYRWRADERGFSMPRCTWYEGRWIRHGDWYPDRLVRLFRKDAARFAGGKGRKGSFENL